MRTHTKILTVKGEDIDAIESVVEGAETNYSLARKQDPTLTLEVQDD